MAKKKQITQFSFVELAESISDKIIARSKLAACYGHPTGTGDEREQALTQILRETLPNRFGVDKCRLIDSHGKISAEFDIVIYEKDYAVTPLTISGRKLLPIESVYSVIEVKSKLSKKDYNKFVDCVVYLDEFKRYYEPIGLHPPGILTKERKEVLAKGIGPQHNFPEISNTPKIGVIVSNIFCYDAPKGKHLANYFARYAEGFHWLCVSGRELITKWANPPGFRQLKSGNKSTGIFLWNIIGILSASQRHLFYRPKLQKYSEALINEIALFPGWQVK